MATFELDFSAALQIVRNPNDLRIMIVSDDVEGEGAGMRRHGFQVFRGSSGGGRRLMGSPLFAESRTEAAEGVYCLLVFLAGLTISGFIKDHTAHGHKFSIRGGSTPVPPDQLLQMCHAEWVRDRVLALDVSGPQIVSTHEMVITT